MPFDGPMPSALLGEIIETPDNRVTLDARGASAGNDLTGSRPVVNAKWRGLMVETPARDSILQGDAQLNYHFASQTLDAESAPDCRKPC